MRGVTSVGWDHLNGEDMVVRGVTSVGWGHLKLSALVTRRVTFCAVLTYLGMRCPQLFEQCLTAKRRQPLLCTVSLVILPAQLCRSFPRVPLVGRVAAFAAFHG